MQIARSSIKSERPQTYNIDKITEYHNQIPNNNEGDLEQISRRYSSASQNVRLKKNLTESKSSINADTKNEVSKHINSAAEKP